MQDEGVPIIGKEARPSAALPDTSACQTGSAQRITRRYDAANKAVGGRRNRWYYSELKKVLTDIISHGAHPYVLSDFFARSVQQGFPIDQNALFADERILAMEARFIALCVPTLKNLHNDCREWLAVKLKKPADRIDGSAGWNALLGGQAINPDER